MDKFEIIKEIYKTRISYIMKNYPRYDPYVLMPIFDWFTPIEQNVWQDIRVIGLPFVPQFPVSGYFIDFADPVKKIGIEVDGKEWHMDKGKDEIRQGRLERLGWVIRRIEGRQTYKDTMWYSDREEDLLEKDPEDDYGKIKDLWKDYYADCSEGILRKLKSEFYNTYEREKLYK
jgi:very-short-patch-repair endonuclease